MRLCTSRRGCRVDVGLLLGERIRWQWFIGTVLLTWGRIFHHGRCIRPMSWRANSGDAANHHRPVESLWVSSRIRNISRSVVPGKKLPALKSIQTVVTSPATWILLRMVGGDQNAKGVIPISQRCRHVNFFDTAVTTAPLAKTPSKSAHRTTEAALLRDLRRSRIREASLGIGWLPPGTLPVALHFSGHTSKRYDRLDRSASSTVVRHCSRIGQISVTTSP